MEIRKCLIQNLETIRLFLIATTKEDDKVLEDATDETFAKGEESYLEDDDSCGEHLEGSSSSLQDDFVASTGGKYY